ncbi:unnamed protein product, partial [marine sediment metagenome]
ELLVLNNAFAHKNYKKPTAILNYLKSLIPNDESREYILRFLRTKLTTFKQSPVILYFIGKAGSGKDTFVSLLSKIIGGDYVTSPSSKVFLETYNGWTMDKYIVQLDEYGNKVTRAFERQEVLGRLKTYTGSPIIQIRAMRQDGFNYRHSITYILTDNSNPLPIELDDRRFYLIETPNKLSEEKWVKEMGGITKAIDKIDSEVLDFCCYLATDVDNLSPDEYMEPPLTENKEELILSSLPAIKKLTYYIENKKLESLVELFQD